MKTIPYVREFHEAMGVESPTRPTMLEGADSPLFRLAIAQLADAMRNFRASAEYGSACALRMALETEELYELGDALQHGNLEAALDAQVDRRYIADGTTLALGMASVFDEAFGRVHAANMRKLCPDGKPVMNAAGKFIKPEGWVAPDLSDLVKP